MAAIEKIKGLAATTVSTLIREGGASILMGFMARVGSMAGVLTECGIKISRISLGVGRRYSHIIICGLQSSEVLEFWWGYHTILSIKASLPLSCAPRTSRK